MNRGKLLGTLLCGGVVACGSAAEEQSKARDPLLNGDPIGNVDSATDPTVLIKFRSKPDLPNGQPTAFGNGTLISQTAVITAAHILMGEDPADTFVTSGNPAVRLERDAVAPFHFAPGFKRDGKTTPVDLAILFIDSPFSPAAEIPELDCDPAIPSALICKSYSVHTDLGTRTSAGVGNLNTVALPFKSPEFNSWEIDYGPRKPNSLGFGKFQSSQSHGDSGVGCYEDTLGDDELSVVNTDGHPVITKYDPADHSKTQIKPNETIGHGTMVAPFCPWIQTTLEGGKKAVSLQHADSDSSPDVVALTQVSGDTFVLGIDSTQNGFQSFDVEADPSAETQGLALGNYTGTGRSLVTITGGSLSVLSVKEGPKPALIGAPTATYSALAKQRMNGDSIDDLVAQRMDGKIDVFLGSSAGLTFNAAIDPVALRLDSDFLPDFVWLNGSAGIGTSSSRFGQSFRNVNPATITLNAVHAGTFQRQTGASQGIEDIIAVGTDSAGGGVVIWCPSNGNGVECEPAIEARFATGRDPTSVIVDDLNTDGLDDLVVQYSNNPNRVFFAKPDGFTPLAPKSHRTFVPLPSLVPEVKPRPDLVALNDEGGLIQFTFIDSLGNEIGPVPTPFPFEEPLVVLAANPNDDGEVPTAANVLALEPGAVPFMDVVVLSGDQLFMLVSNGDGTFGVETLNAPPGTLNIEAGDVTGDGIDDIQALLDDGSVTVFAGSPSGLDPVGQNFTGLPTPDAEDGKMLLLSGLGVDTVGATEARFRISVAEDDLGALDELNVQVFDGDNGGLHQFEEQTNVLKTCYRLSADPCGDGNAGSCSGGPTPPVELVTVSSDTLGDDVWDTIFQGAHAPQASIAGDGLPPYNYELRVFLSDDCAVLPTPGSTLSVATADAFKVRSNGMLSMPAGEFSLVGSDSDGEFGVSGLPYLRATNFDGNFDLPIAVGSSATEIQLKEADADDTTDATPGVSLGANAEIQYRLLNPSGNPVNLVGAENTAATQLVTNPSGNNDGLAALDVETRIHTIGAPTTGTYTWQWQNVRATNAFHVFTPFGSPTTHEVLGARRARPKLTTAEQPYYWEEREVLQAALPIVLGRKLPDGTLEGTSIELVDAAAAAAILDNAGATLDGELQRQLLVAKLNAVRGGMLGENLAGALVYGTTTTVRSTLSAADDAVAGVDVLRDDRKTQRLITLLSSVNLGEITYQQPGVPFPELPMADLDADGILDLKDNCPAVANPDQADEDDNRIGDACNVRPFADCVLARSPEHLTAFFGYENPLSRRTIAAGTRNRILSSAGEREFEQPSEFDLGFQVGVFAADFADDESLSWELEGELAIADRETVACSGRELAQVDFVPQAALFGSESVVIGDHVSVRAASEHASIVSGGEVIVGGESSVGNVFAAGRTLLGGRSVIEGAAATGAALERQQGAKVLGTARDGAVFRTHSLAWHVQFAASAQDALLSPNEVRTLSPGDYGKVVVPSGAALTLAPGRYRFAALEVATGGTLALGAGETVIHVHASLVHRGETRLSGSASVVLGYFGSAAAVLDASFEGTVIAPNATLQLGAVRNSRFVGAFFARSVEVQPSSIVEFARR
jgi:hypothetical protein